MVHTVVYGTSANVAPWDVERLNNRRKRGNAFLPSNDAKSRLYPAKRMTQDTVKAVMPLLESDDSTRREIGKTDNGIVLLTTHLYDGVRRLPLDVALLPSCWFSRTGERRPYVC